MIVSNRFFKSFRLRALFLLLPALFAGYVYFAAQNNSAAAAVEPSADSKFTATFSAKPESLRNLTPAAKSGNCANAVPTSMDISFDVSGLKGAVDNVEVQNLVFDPNFKWGANLSAVLISPDGVASQTLFGDPNAKVKKCGQEISFAGQHNFRLKSGNDQNSNISAAAVAENNQLGINSAFNKINDANGTWILRLTDNAGGAFGKISGVSLSIATNQATVTRYVNVDFDGDKKSDYVVIRPDENAFAAKSFAAPMNFNYANRYKKLHHFASAAPNNLTAADSNLTWYSSFASSGTFSSAKNGDVNTDTPVPADYDGDGKTDIAVWRPLAQNDAAFYIIQSATNTLRIDHFGNEGDDPRVTADYDGDHIADVATFRCPATVPGPCYYYYRGSLNNPNQTIFVVPWGFGTSSDFFPYAGDFDGDGKADFCLQRENPSYPGLSQFVLLKSSDYTYEFINWGLLSDSLVPGDYDGDGKTDFAVVRLESLPSDPNDRLSFYILTRAGGGTGNSPIRFGDGDDYLVPGDYDGDGKTDIAVFRQYPDSSDPTPDQSKFIVYKSSDKGVIYYPWGKPGDFPAAAWQAIY